MRRKDVEVVRYGTKRKEEEAGRGKRDLLYKRYSFVGLHLYSTLVLYCGWVRNEKRNGCSKRE